MPVWLLISSGALWVALLARVNSRDARLRKALSIVAFRLERDNRITLIHRNGQHTAGRISDGGLVTPLLILFNVSKDEHGNRSVLLMRDSMNREDFRRLRVVFRWAGDR